MSCLVSKVLCFDTFQSNDWIDTIPNAEYVSLDELFKRANIISVHVPLLPETKYMINKDSISKMPKNVIIVSIIIDKYCDKK